ncbi:MAG: hypothetical protein JSV26_06145 [bacterium]|nr:MAG: hypothetical protein JSV26_06145 [bacterium]
MVHILEHSVDLQFPLGDGIHCLIAQIPNRLHMEDRLFKLIDPDDQRNVIRSVVDLAASHDADDQLHFLVLPESSVPYSHLEELIETIGDRFSQNTVAIFGLEHITLLQYMALMERHAEDNEDSLAMVRQAKTKSDRDKPVNLCATVIKERSGRVRCFFSAKTHPFAGEESVDHGFDLFRGKSFLLFRCEPMTFNFMPLICFDYVYRDLNSSNIMAIIEMANDMYARQRQELDLLVVIQCNPKPEHKVFRDVATGFYGEHLFKTPGVRDTITVFVNTSEETELAGSFEKNAFGYSYILCGIRHKLPRIKLSEFRTDDFHGSSVSRLRFGQATRIYTTRIFPHHETDPRSSRAMLKVTGVYYPAPGPAWLRIKGDDLVMGVSDEDQSTDW